MKDDDGFLDEPRHHVETRTISGKTYGVKVDLRDFTRPRLVTVPAHQGPLHWQPERQDLRRTIDWERVLLHIDTAFAEGEQKLLEGGAL